MNKKPKNSYHHTSKRTSVTSERDTMFTIQGEGEGEAEGESEAEGEGQLAKPGGEYFLVYYMQNAY